ncbi:MAG: beta-aspartyl-peptidase [Gemmatimonadaceae bacterium]|nr:beta-aspartyl-peptidase [Gemmatimonadaceae bacterium]
MTAPTLELLLNAELYTPDPMGVCHLLIGGGRLLYVGTERPSVTPSSLVAVTDLAGARVIPGLIDGHVHLTGGGGEAGPASRVPAPPLTAYTLGGVTSAVGVLGTDDVVRTTASLVAAARSLTAEGLSAWCHTGGYHLPLATLTGSVRGDIVHVDCIIGVGELAISDHRSSQPTFDEIVRIAGDAHVAGLMTGKAGILHLHVGDGPRGLECIRRALAETELPARVFQPTHVNRRRSLFDEAVALAREGVPVDITDFPVDDGEDAWCAADALERYWERGAPAGKVTVSTDGGGCLPVFDNDRNVIAMDVGDSRALSRTIATLLARGHALETVLPPFTRNVAEALRLHGKGRLVVGADADVVVLGSNHLPLHVMARGAWMVRNSAPVRRGTFEVGA